MGKGRGKTRGEGGLKVMGEKMGKLKVGVREIENVGKWGL